jgi:hypothetical protein
MDTYALLLALRALQMEIRALASLASTDENYLWKRADADRLMDEAEKAAREPEARVLIGVPKEDGLG